MTLPAGTPIGKYVVRRKIAEGGMAEIYLAKAQGPEGFEKDVVIKRIRSYLADDPGFVQMFIAEARLASRLNHANLVQIFDFDKHEDTYYLAMEYVRGPSLWDVRKKTKERMEPMPPTLVAQVGAEVARGLQYAHRLTDKGKPLNLVHRDVTPHNVLLSYDGAVKLTDFGVAKAGNSKTAAGVLKGKFAYMSPEQARGEEVDARTDVFALGIVLWEMLTGGRLFDGDSDVAVLRAVQQSQIAPPARLNPEIAPELDAVVMKALERDPAKRYQTAQELERALAQYVMTSARSLDDTDVGAFLRRLFEQDGSAVSEIGRDGTGSGPLAEPAGTPVSAPKKREPTAVMSGGLSAPVSADEDINAATHVVARSGNRVPTPPMGIELGPARATPATPANGPATPARATPANGAPLAGSAPVTPLPQATPVPSVIVRTGPGPLVIAIAGLALLATGGGVVYALTRPGAPATAVSTPAAPSVATQTSGQGTPPRDPAMTPSPAAAAQGPAGPKGGSPSNAVAGNAPASTNPAGPVTTGAPPAQASVIGSPASASSGSGAGTSPAQSGAAPATAAHEPTPVAAGSTPPTGGAPAELSMGTLVLKVTPWGMVSIDGKKAVEVNPRGIFKVAAGKHHLRVEHGHDVREKDVVVDEGKRVSRDFNFLAPSH